MLALLSRNLKIYFSNLFGVLMSLLGALISFVIYIGFLKNNLTAALDNVPHITKIMDLWMSAGIVSIAGITTSFQALGQLVKDRESRTFDDLQLTDLPLARQNLTYVLSSAVISFIMQAATLAVMIAYFTLTDHISVPMHTYLPLTGYMLLGAIAATMLNELIIIFISSSTTFSRMSSIIGAIAGFAVATYLPYGALTNKAQDLIELVPSSYEAAALRSQLLRKIINQELPLGMQNHFKDYLGIQFNINGYRLDNIIDAYVIFGMILILMMVIIVISAVIDRKRTN